MFTSMTRGKEKNRFLLLYGSQTGQAQAIAEEIAENAPKHGLLPDIHCMSMTEKRFWLEREKCVVFIISTTGDGEPPETTLKFWRRLKKRTLPSDHLQHIHYTMLGLGDSNYTNFCKCGQTFNRRLEELGANHFYPVGWADDAGGLEAVADPWMDGLWPVLRTQLGLSPEDKTNNLSTDSVISNPGCSDQVNGTEANGESHSPDANSIKDTSLSEPTADDITKEDSSSQVKLKEGNNVKVSTQNSPTTELSSVESVSQTTVPSSEYTDNQSKSSEVTETKEPSSELGDKQFNTSNDTAETNVPSSELADKQGTFATAKTKVPSSEFSNTQQTTSIAKSQYTPIITSNSMISKRENNAMNTPSSGNSISDTGKPDSNGSTAVNSGDVVDSGAKSAQPSLVVSEVPLSESSLTLPLCPSSYLKLDFHPEERLEDLSLLPHQNCSSLPLASTELKQLPIVGATKLTRHDAVKTALKIQLDISDTGWKYLPGDSFGIVCRNEEDEVNELINRLNLAEQANVACTLSLLPNTKKRNAAVPSHYPPSCALQHLLTHCCDIRAVPKKVFVRALVEHTSHPREKRRLQELCSRQGSDHYSKFVRDPSLSLMDILHSFPSCHPPVEVILEQLPRLQPRSYSACSCQEVLPNSLEFVFNIIEIPSGAGRRTDRQGLCTGWLNSITQQLQAHSPGGAEDRTAQHPQGVIVTESGLGESLCEGAMAQLSLVDRHITVPLYLRKNQHFHPPEDPSTPYIMIGPGTGVAPFIGFLHHRKAALGCTSPSELGDTWLFFGCRHKERDFLFRKELEAFTTDGTLTYLHVSFSRDEPQGPDAPRYVQDSMRLHGPALVDLICDRGAYVYVCGDANSMAKNVTQTFVDLLMKNKDMDQKEAQGHLMQMRLHKRYLEDVWA